jgi:hypothetical protein
MRLLTSFLFVASLSLVACGGDGGTGLDSNKALGTLTTAELTDLCEYVVDQYPSEPVDCDGTEVEPPTVQECVDDPFPEDCTATVGQAEACAEALGADPCAMSLPEACAPLFECF